MTEATRPALTIEQCVVDKRVCGGLPVFKRPETTRNWRALWKAMDGLPLDDEEFEIFKHFTGRTVRPVRAFKTILMLAGRRTLKSFTSALKLVHLAVFHPWPRFMGKAYVLCLAADKQQSAVVHGYVRDILRQPAFRGLIVRETAEEIELRNRIVIGIHSSNFRTLRGLRILACSCDEMSYWFDSETSRNPAAEILTSLEPALGENESSQLIIPTTPYIRSGPVFELYRDFWAKDDPDVLVIQGTTLELNPTYRASIVEKALARDPAAARAEYLAEFRADLETYVQLELIEQAMVGGRGDLLPARGVFYHAFCDPSELVKGGDSMTLAISHSSGGKAIVDRVVEVRPPANPKEVVGSFAQVLRDYRIGELVEDRVSIGWIRSEFEPLGIGVKPCDQSKSELYSLLAVKLQGRQVELPDDERLKSQLLGLERRNLSGGGFRIDHRPGAHDDVANCTAGAVHLASAGIGDAEPAATMDIDIYPEDGGAGDYSAMDYFRSVVERKTK